MTFLPSSSFASSKSCYFCQHIGVEKARDDLIRFQRLSCLALASGPPSKNNGFVARVGILEYLKGLIPLLFFPWSQRAI
jgi:hypothetical protein